MLLQALAVLDEALELDFGALETDELELDLIDELELGTFDELALDLIDELDTFAELTLDLLNELDLLDETALAAVDDTPVPLVGIEHSLVALAGLGSTPKVAVLHTKVPLNTL